MGQNMGQTSGRYICIAQQCDSMLDKLIKLFHGIVSIDSSCISSSSAYSINKKVLISIYSLFIKCTHCNNLNSTYKVSYKSELFINCSFTVYLNIQQIIR